MLITLEQARAQLSLFDTVDDALITSKIAAAESYLNSQLGFIIAERFGGEGQDPTPPALAEAALQLVAHWYENREAGGEALRAIPFGVSEIIDAHRDWSF